MTSKDINEHIWKHYNYNFLAAQKDLEFIERADKHRKRMRKTTPLWLGMTAVSGYNMSRLGFLSASGRVATVSGLVLGSVMTIYTTQV